MLVSGAHVHGREASQRSTAGVGGQPLLSQERLSMGRRSFFPSSLLQGHALEEEGVVGTR